jgi:elongation factor G
VIDLVAMKACMFANDGSGKPVDGAIPGGMIETANAARDALIEMVAEADDALMEKFFDAGTLSQDDLVVGLKRGVAAARIFPGAADLGDGNIGMQPLLDAIVAYVPSPAERPLKARTRTARTSRSRRRTAAGGAFVWKTVADPFAGRITLFRVISGTLKADSTLHNARKDTPERLGHLICCRARRRRTCRRSRPATSARSPS